jgi:hypothetical protein
MWADKLISWLCSCRLVTGKGDGHVSKSPYK